MADLTVDARSLPTGPTTDAAVPLSNYTVKFPDGTSQSFRGPANMTDQAVYQRAVQEKGISIGSIPTTRRAGIVQSLGDTAAENSDNLGLALGLTGSLLAQPEVVAAAPLVGRAIKAGGQYISGRKVDVPSGPELATLAAEGALSGYAPVLGEKFAATTVAHPSAITGQFVKGVAGSGVPAWAARTAGEAAHLAANSPVMRAAAIVGPDELRQYIMRRLNGQAP